MRRKFITVFALILMLALTSSAFASFSHEGSLEFHWDKDSKLTHSESAKLTYDLRKDFGHGFAAGLTFKVYPFENKFEQSWDGWANMDFDHTFVSLSSWKEFTGASYFLAQGKKLPGGPGAIVDFKQLEDLTLQGHIGNYWGGSGMVYTFGAKAGYSLDDVNLNLGFHGKNPDKLLYGVFVGADTKINSEISIKGEVGYRNDLEDWHSDGAGNWWMEKYATGTAVGAQVDYSSADVRGSLLGMYKSPLYIAKDWDNNVANNARDLYLMSEWTGTLLGLNVEYDVTPYLTAKAKVDALIGVVDSRDDSNTSKVHDIKPFGFRLDASYRASLGTTVSGWYSQYDTSQRIGAGVDYWEWKITGSYDLNSKYAEAEVKYTFVDGFVGSLYANKPDGEDIGYGLKLKITL